MAVTISYKNSKISEINNSNTKTLETAGKYCESNIIINYNREGNKIVEGNSSIVITDAEEGNICALTQYGVCEQDASTNAISCNNGVLSISSGEIITTGTNETVTIGSQTATIENLYSVGNIKDEQEIVTGRVTRKNDICIYDGTQPVGDKYISSTGAKDNGAIIIYPREEEYTNENVVSFNKNTEEDINSLEVSMSPIQSLNGYSNPWPAGGGKNKFLTTLETNTKNQVTATVDSDGFIHLSGTANATTIFQLGRYTFAAGEYYITMCPPGGSTSTYRVYASFGSNDTGNGWTRTFTQETEITFQISINSGTNVDGLVFKPMICLSSEGTAFAPYANICPISGLTGVDIYKVGHELISIPQYSETINGCTLTVVDESTIRISGTPSSEARFIFPLSTNTDFEFNQSTMRFYVNDSFPTGINLNVSGRGPNGGYQNFSFRVKTTFGGDTVDLGIHIYAKDDESNVSEAYQEDTYAFDWSTQAGTVYGGTLDVVTGALTVSWACASRRLSTFNLIETKTNTKHYRYLDNFFGGSLPADAGSGNLCNIAPNAYNSSDATHFYPVKSNGRIELWVPVDLSTDTEVQIAAPIATPITYQLTPQEVQTLVGQNNIFSPDTTSIKVAVSNPRIEQVTPQPLTLVEGDNTITATNLNVSSVPLELEYIANGDNLLYGSNTSNYVNAGAADYMII